MITTAELLAQAAEAEANAAAQEAEANTMRAVVDQKTTRLAHALADRKRAHRKATRTDRPQSHHIGRAELRRLDEETLPAIKEAITAAQADVDHLTADAARLRQVAADYRAQAGLTTLNIPAPFCNWFLLTPLAENGTAETPDHTATRDAFNAATDHGTHRTITATPAVLAILDEYAAACQEANAYGDHDPAEAAAADTLAARIRTARRTLKTAQEAQQGPQDAQEAPTAPATLEAPARPRSNELASTKIGSDVITLVEIIGGEFTHGIDTYRPADDADEFDHGTRKGTPVLSAQAGFYSENEARADYTREVARRTQETAQDAQEAPTAPATAQGPQKATTGPVLADWERDLLAADEEPCPNCGTPAEPDAPLHAAPCQFCQSDGHAACQHATPAT